MAIETTHPIIPSFISDPDSFLEWAVYFNDFGLSVIPLIPGEKRSVCQWYPWLADLSKGKVVSYWATNPTHELGFIVGPKLIVLDTDTPEAETALCNLEKKFHCEPSLVINTKHGTHHYFRHPPKVYAKCDAHSTSEFPNRIDIKTDRGLVVLPPSPGKSICKLEFPHADLLAEVTQEFIDAIFEHNGRPAPRAATPALIAAGETMHAPEPEVRNVLAHISPDCGYQDWLQGLMGIFSATGGSKEGFALANEWSARGQKYKGVKEIEAKWKSFRLDCPAPVTMGSLVHMARESGAKVLSTITNDSFVPCDFEIVEEPVPTVTQKGPAHPLLKYSLQGQAEEIAARAVTATPLLDDIAMLGNATVIYAAPNTGKTLLTLSMLIKAIKDKRVDPRKVFYINVDDSSSGVADKARLADEYSFHLLAEGHNGFTAKRFNVELTALTQIHVAPGTVIILDTLKKFARLMDKTATSEFTQLVRNFVLHGGTVIALAHTNKRPDAEGKPIFGGTSDVLDDFDAGYILSTHMKDADSKVVEFANIKRRGSNAMQAAYRYTLENKISYTDLLLSVEQVDMSDLAPIKHQADLLSDAEFIATVVNCINEGICTKMELARAVMERAKVSRQRATGVIEKYTGDDPASHRWSFKVKARGAKVYALLTPASTPPPESAF